MRNHEQLLDEARQFCDPKTGEVVQRIPDELMQKLREAQLARGIPGRRSSRTDSHATWFVFLTDDIRDQFLDEWRAVKRTRKRSRGTVEKANSQPSSEDSPATPAQGKSRGLKQFVQRRKSVG